MVRVDRRATPVAASSELGSKNEKLTHLGTSSCAQLSDREATNSRAIAKRTQVPMASQAVFRTDAGSNRGLDATVGFDYSPGDVAQENVQVTVGGRFNAPFASRQNERVGVALVYSKISDSFSSFGTLLGGTPLGSEKAVELNYSPGDTILVRATRVSILRRRGCQWCIAERGRSRIPYES